MVQRQRPALEGSRQLRPIVVLCTDGDHNEGPPPEAVATALRTKADLIAVGFGEDADMALLRRIATSPEQRTLLAALHLSGRQPRI